MPIPLALATIRPVTWAASGHQHDGNIDYAAEILTRVTMRGRPERAAEGVVCRGADLPEAQSVVSRPPRPPGGAAQIPPAVRGRAACPTGFKVPNQCLKGGDPVIVEKVQET
jgi:hypothetical protein